MLFLKHGVDNVFPDLSEVCKGDVIVNDNRLFMNILLFMSSQPLRMLKSSASLL